MEQPPSYEVGEIVNGHRWTGTTWEPVFPEATAPAGADKPWYKKWWGIALIILGMLTALSMVTDGGSDQASNAVPSQQPTPAVVTESSSPSPTDSPTPASTPTPVESASPSATATASKASAAPAKDKKKKKRVKQIVMPNFYGRTLQDSQDWLQKRGSYLVDQEDAKGLDRFQFLDSNWKVCRQRPAPGTVVSVNRLVKLWSVKLSESC